TDWVEYQAKDGRKYYHNKKTNATTWEKPDELKTPEEAHCTIQFLICGFTFLRGQRATNWKEYVAKGGRKYWYNAVTKVTTWDMPEELK
ncbi:hypothetical protein EV182_007536, partial [Spiromyces aspiralis]